MSLTQQMIHPDQLVANPWNTNEVDSAAMQQLENSILRFGFFRPVVVRERGDAQLEILGGEHRWTIAQKLGIAEIPIINLGRISDERAKEIGLADNARYGHDDTLALAELLKDMGSTDELQTFLPLSSDDLASIFAAETIALDDLDSPDDEPPPRERPSPTHQVMRFKVPVEDVAKIQAKVERTMKEQGFIGDDSMTNAGHALVHLMKEVA
jgi:ParB family chromosome partitioning protein